jgi:signal transduction histidine kinase
MTARKMIIPFEIWLSGGYIIIALTWIFASDNILELIISESIYQLSYFQTIKGAGFVFTTGIMLWWLMRRKRLELEEYANTLRVVNQNLRQDIAERERAQKELAVMTERFEERVAEGIQEERQRLARELHDAVTQTMFSASMIAESLIVMWERKPEQVLDGLKQLQQLTRGAVADMRMLLIELRPRAIEEIRLPQLLKQLCESYAGRNGIVPELIVDNHILLPVNVRHAFYRIAQEALNNISKYAKATHITLSLEEKNGTVIMRIEDNGIGFELDKVKDGAHFGLKIMQERAQAMNAIFLLKSKPNHGTSIYVAWDSR